jgi:hypothetical protein
VAKTATIPTSHITELSSYLISPFANRRAVAGCLQEGPLPVDIRVNRQLTLRLHNVGLHNRAQHWPGGRVYIFGILKPASRQIFGVRLWAFYTSRLRLPDGPALNVICS